MKSEKQYETPNAVIFRMSIREDILLASSEQGTLAQIDCSESNWQ